MNSPYIKLKINLNKLAISGTSGTLTASNLQGEPLGEAIPYDQACNEHKILLESLTSGEEIKSLTPLNFLYTEAYRI